MPTRLMRAGGNEAPPDFDLSVLHRTHKCAHWMVHAHTQKTCIETLTTYGLLVSWPLAWNYTLSMGCTNTMDGVWILGSPLVASSVTVFQRPAIHYIQLSIYHDPFPSFACVLLLHWVLNQQSDFVSGTSVMAFGCSSEYSLLDTLQ